jgi:prephenate dehydrogenase
VYIHHLKEFKESLKRNEQENLKQLIVNANKIREVLEGESTTMTKNEETIIKFYTK